MYKLVNTIIIVLFIALFFVSFSPGLFLSIIIGNVDETLKIIFFEYRFQSFMLFPGAIFFFTGIRVIKTKHFVIRKRDLLLKKDGLPFNKGNDVEFRGKAAIKIGLVFVLFGLIALVWSISFWIYCVAPVIF